MAAKMAAVTQYLDITAHKSCKTNCLVIIVLFYCNKETYNYVARFYFLFSSSLLTKEYFIGGRNPYHYSVNFLPRCVTKVVEGSNSVTISDGVHIFQNLPTIPLRIFGDGTYRSAAILYCFTR